MSMGCRFGQGYLLAMPMTPPQAETLARTRSRLFPGLPHQTPGSGTTRMSLPAAG
jgi:hypothetical protein